jgi:SAM-dependent methyltransferase
MNPRLFKEYERICSQNHITGAVLEVGAVPGASSLLCMKSLTNAREKVGVNLDGPHQYKDFRILKMNANNMNAFEDGRFDVTLCNGVLEHDPYFWRTVSEIKRVTAPGGLIVIGAPGYKQWTEGTPAIQKNILFRAFTKFRWLPFMPAIFRGTLTLEVHNAPGDYYRFSTQAFREIICAGLNHVEIRTLNYPPSIIGIGNKP